MIGQHCVKTSSHIQSIIALGSGESEYYAAVGTGRTALHFSALLQDWGVRLDMKIVLKSDSSAAIGFTNRRGLSRLMKHISTKYLWLQERVAMKDMVIAKVGTKEQLADHLTKPLSANDIARASRETGLEFRHGRAALQKGSL